MKKLEDLFELELKNLYALEKQIANTFETIDSPNDKKFNKRTQNFKELNSKDFETIQELLQEHSINPGNTTDSVANEMLMNISEQSRDDLNKEVRDAGVLASMIRLNSYKTSNYKTVQRLAKSLKKKKIAKKLKKIGKRSDKSSKDFFRLGKKKLFKSSS